MSNDREFPLELLERPLDERLAYFERQLIRHTFLEDVLAEVIRWILYPCGKSMLLVVGATGAGKTTLHNELLKALAELFCDLMAANPGCIPYASAQAIAEGADAFNWIDFYRRALEALQEILIDRKVNYSDVVSDHGVKKNEITKASLRKVFEDVLKNRENRTFLIDEGPHMARVAGGKSLLYQIDSLKSLAQQSHTVFVLFGTYGLLDLPDLSGQLNRRIKKIHFPRYDYANSEHRKIFKSVVAQLPYYLPVEEVPDLLAHSEFLYIGSLGLVGSLFDWFSRALVEADAAKAKTITKDILERTMDPMADLEIRMDEIIEGEKRIVRSRKEEERREQKLRKKLKMEPIKKKDKQGDAPPKQSKDEVKNGSTEDTSPKPPKRKTKPGVRLPKRDKIGPPQYD